MPACCSTGPPIMAAPNFPAKAWLTLTGFWVFGGSWFVTGFRLYFGVWVEGMISLQNCEATRSSGST